MTREDYIKILSETKDNIIVQAIKSIRTEGIKLVFTKSAIEEIASVSEEVNRHDEDTGARRLVSILDLVMEEISFEAADLFEEYGTPDKALV